MLSLGCPKFNLQFESTGVVERLLESVKNAIPDEDDVKVASQDLSINNENKIAAFQVSSVQNF